MDAILAAIDRLDRPSPILARARGLASALGARLALVHVGPHAGAAGAGLRPEDAEALRFRTGPAAEAIIEVAESEGAGLIVMGRPTRRPLRELFAGTTLEQTLRLSHRPVLMAAAETPEAYRRILFAVDFSPAAEAAAALIGALKLVPGAEVHLAHAFSSPESGLLIEAGAGMGAVRASLRQSQIEVQAELALWASAHGLVGARRHACLCEGATAETLLGLAERLKSELIVVGSHAKTGLSRALLGSVAHGILVGAACDVLVAPPRA
ncbi:MAG TPA: universal stress protein [Phenylobacterium sp.]|nr:universal stress protein [Phenylobacterium sp.]